TACASWHFLGGTRGRTTGVRLSNVPRECNRLPRGRPGRARVQFRPMRERLRKLWPFVKLLLGLAIVVVIGRRFYLDLRDHPELLRQPLRPGWLLLSGALYLLGLGFSALCWHRLLRALGQRPSFPSALRAYYIGHMGKYLPGKAWALFLRAGL